MPDVFRGTIRFINQRRRTDILEVVLPVRVIRREAYVFVEAGALGSVMCHRKPWGTFEGVPHQLHRYLPLRIAIREIHDLDEGRRIRIVFEGVALNAADPTEVPGIPFLHGTIDGESESDLA